MQDHMPTVIRFFTRIEHSLTLQIKVQALSPTDYTRLWRLALECGYPVTYPQFLAVCRVVDVKSLAPVVARIVNTLQTSDNG